MSTFDDIELMLWIPDFSPQFEHSPYSRNFALSGILSQTNINRESSNAFIYYRGNTTSVSIDTIKRWS